jgi:hypothetical protein
MGRCRQAMTASVTHETSNAFDILSRYHIGNSTAPRLPSSTRAHQNPLGLFFIGLSCRYKPIKQPRFIGGLAVAALASLPAITAGEVPLNPAIYSGRPGSPPVTLATYRSISASKSRQYDRTQDISARQMLVLLEVAERTGSNLGQALATGEMESAHTWNDHVRPTLQNGDLGSATGVWQFIPSTFHRIIKMFGTQLLAASASDATTGREHLDLGEGPFTDAKVRSLIQETVDGQRGAKDDELQLLRHNFAVLAFAKHYLSVESGATSPEEDYLFHFLGEGLGRRVLKLARGEARYTLCIKSPEVPVTPSDSEPELLAGNTPKAPAATQQNQPPEPPALTTGPNAMAVSTRTTSNSTRLVTTSPPNTRSVTPLPATRSAPDQRVVVAQPLPGSTLPLPTATSNKGSASAPVAPRLASATTVKPPVSPAVAAAERRPTPTSWWLEVGTELLTSDSAAALVRTKTRQQTTPRVTAQPAIATTNAIEAPPPVSSEWGLPANSATVTGNLGMFYRDGKGKTQPYTWAEFMQNLAKRVRANNQPELVRAKYGVGFPLKGGDVAERTFKPEQVAEVTEFCHENDLSVLVPELMITGTLSQEETRQYKRRLVEMVSRGEDRPLDTLPPEVLSALHHLKLLPPKVQETSTAHPQVQKALQSFRKKIGKDSPDDPAHLNLLMPAERIALEIYAQRLDRYAVLQAGQLSSLKQAPDLHRIIKMSTGRQKTAAPHIAAVQTALAGQGLLTPPTQKTVWRDKKKKKHVEYKTAPFTGKVDQTTVAALSTFQVRHGLRRTEGVLDAMTLKILGLPPMGQDLFSPLSGPQCAFYGWTDEALPRSDVPTEKQRSQDGIQIPNVLPGSMRPISKILSFMPPGPDAFMPLYGPQCSFNGWTESPPMSEVMTELGEDSTPRKPNLLTQRRSPPTLLLSYKTSL